MQFGFSTQVARKTYCCDRCMQIIYRNDEYNRWLWKVGPRRVLVMREHDECPPDELWEDFEESSEFDEGPPLALAA